MRRGIIYTILNRISNYFLPNYLTEQIMYELLVYRTRFFAKKTLSKNKGKKDLKINVGCGESGKEGWENVDAVYSVGVNNLWDCARSLPFDNNSAKIIYSEHFIEHVDFYEDAPQLFKDMHRILIPGGLLRIIVPCAQKYVEAYMQPGWDALAKVRPLSEGNVDVYSNRVMHTKMELVNWVFRQEYQHKYAYDFDTLKFALENAGFKTVLKQDFGKSLNADALIDMPIRASESLYIEAVKE